MRPGCMRSGQLGKKGARHDFELLCRGMPRIPRKPAKECFRARQGQVVAIASVSAQAVVETPTLLHDLGRGGRGRCTALRGMALPAKQASGMASTLSILKTSLLRASAETKADSVDCFGRPRPIAGLMPTTSRDAFGRPRRPDGPRRPLGSANAFGCLHRLAQVFGPNQTVVDEDARRITVHQQRRMPLDVVFRAIPSGMAFLREEGPVGSVVAQRFGAGPTRRRQIAERC